MFRYSKLIMPVVLSSLTLLVMACSETKTVTKPGLEESRPETSRPADSSRPLPTREPMWPKPSILPWRASTANRLTRRPSGMPLKP